MAASRSGMTSEGGALLFQEAMCCLHTPNISCRKPDEHRLDDDIALHETGEAGRYAVTSAIHGERTCDQLDKK